jgi:polysaccharide pyruvyl transferase
MGPAAVVRVAAGVQSKLVVALTTDFQDDPHSDAATGDVRRGGGRDGVQRIGVLDTSIATRNTGDLIIMEAARSVLDTLLVDHQIIYFPTHERLSAYGRRLQRLVTLNVACGTNLLHSHMGLVHQWNLGFRDAFAYRRTVLMGVGWRSQRRRKTDWYTRWLLRRVLSMHHAHSVRDSYAERKLQEVGFDRVLNTGCPTTWVLTEAHCAAIPRSRGEEAIVVLTDYSPEPERDSYLIALCLKMYRKVHFWCQGTGDLAYLQELGYRDRVELVSPSLAAYRRLLNDTRRSLDYVGTRLHGGIYALRHKRRSIIVGVDHRAKEMGRDINLPVIDRYAPSRDLEQMIGGDFTTEVRLPLTTIYEWQRQFSSPTTQGLRASDLS